MNLVKANTLRSKADVLQRFVFHIVWVTIPGAAILLVTNLFGYRKLLNVQFLGFIIAIPLLGAIVNTVRLKTKGSSNQKVDHISKGSNTSL